MSEKDQKKIFSANLISYLGNRSQIDVAKAIGVSPQTFNTWCQGIALPRMGKLQLLADYFGINKSDLIEDKKNKASDLVSIQVNIDERNVLQIYRRLNSSGKEQLLEYARFLSSQDKFAVSNDDSDEKEA